MKDYSPPQATRAIPEKGENLISRLYSYPVLNKLQKQEKQCFFRKRKNLTGTIPEETQMLKILVKKTCPLSVMFHELKETWTGN